MNATIVKENNTLKQHTELYLDLLRGVSILFVILLHALSYYLHDAFFYGSKSWYIFLWFNGFVRTGVPLFLMISGYLHLTSDLANNTLLFYKKRLTRIVLPLLIWNVVYFFGQVLTGQIDFSLDQLFADMLNIGTYYHLWYLYALVGIYLVTPFLKKIVNCSTTMELWILWVLIAFCGTLRPFLNVNLPIYIFFFDPLFNGYLSFYLMGYILGTRKQSSKTTFCLVAMGIAFTLHNMIYCHLHSSSEQITMPFNGGYDLHHLVNGIAMFSLASYLCSSFPEKHWTFCRKVLAQFSFSVYLIHAGIMEIIFQNFPLDTSPVVAVLFLFATTTVLSFLLAFLYHSIKNSVRKNKPVQ